MLHIVNASRRFRRRNGRLESRPLSSRGSPRRARKGGGKPLPYSTMQDPKRTSVKSRHSRRQSIASLADSTAS